VTDRRQWLAESLGIRLERFGKLLLLLGRHGEVGVDLGVDLALLGLLASIPHRSV